jgi:hypothetical protein
MSTPSSTSGGLPSGAAPSTDLADLVTAIVRRELATPRQVVSGGQYTTALRVASARAGVDVQGIGTLPTGGGNTVPVDDLSPQLRLARRQEHGRSLAPELKGPAPPRGFVSGGDAFRRALARQGATVLAQEQAQDQETGRQVQQHQQRGMAISGAFEAHLVEDRYAQQRQQLEAEQAAWRASVAHAQQEGARLADRQAQAALSAVQPHTTG